METGSSRPITQAAGESKSNFMSVEDQTTTSCNSVHCVCIYTAPAGQFEPDCAHGASGEPSAAGETPLIEGRAEVTNVGAARDEVDEVASACSSSTADQCNNPTEPTLSSSPLVEHINVQPPNVSTDLCACASLEDCSSSQRKEAKSTDDEVIIGLSATETKITENQSPVNERTMESRDKVNDTEGPCDGSSTNNNTTENISSIRDISRVDVDDLDSDSIGRLQQLLRQFQVQLDSAKTQTGTGLTHRTTGETENLLTDNDDRNYVPTASADDSHERGTTPPPGTALQSAAVRHTAEQLIGPAATPEAADDVISDNNYRQSTAQQHTANSLTDNSLNSTDNRSTSAQMKSDDFASAVENSTKPEEGSDREAAAAADDAALDSQSPTSPFQRVTLLLKLQREMARMHLEMTRLQEAMRAADNVLQQLLDVAFSDVSQNN